MIRNAFFAACAVICLLVGVTYIHCSESEPIIDDRFGITTYDDLGLIDNIVKEWTQPTYLASSGEQFTSHMPWAPLTTSTQRVLSSVVGQASIQPFRLLNLIMHTLGSLAVGFTTYRLSRSAAAAAFAGTALFVHPMTADSVSWASDLFDVQGGAIAACALLAATYLESPRGFAYLGFCTALLAGLSKSTLACTGLVVAAVPLVSLSPSWRRAGAAFIGGAFGVIVHQTIYRAVLAPHTGMGVLEIVFTEGRPWLTPAIALAFLGDMPSPSLPTFSRPFFLEYERTSMTIGAALAVLGAIALIVGRQRPAVRAFGIGMAVFLITVAPASLFVSWYECRSIRYAYGPLAVALPFIGVAIAPQFERRLRIMAFAGVIALTVWSARTMTRIPDWSSHVALFGAERGTPVAINGQPVPEMIINEIWFRRAVFANAQRKARNDAGELLNDKLLCDSFTLWVLDFKQILATPRLPPYVNLNSERSVVMRGAKLTADLPCTSPARRMLDR